ncbi:MAG: ParB N-terminal domain-containing protein, partial [Planctomycetota bacterium]
MKNNKYSDPPERPSGRASNPLNGAGDEVREIPLDRIIPNRFQPRKAMEPKSLQELIDSIRTAGVLQPIVVRQDP